MIYVVTQQILPESSLFTVISPTEALEKLKPLTSVGLDTETMGLDPYTCTLLTLQLGCEAYQVVVDTLTVDINFFKEYLESDRLFIGWNIKFDLTFLLHKKIVVKEVYDGFLAEKLLYLGYPNGMHSFSLYSAGKNYCNIELDKSVRGTISYAGLSESVIVYAAHDVKYLNRIKYEQEKLLEKANLIYALMYENKSVPWVAYTEYCGVFLDKKKWQYKMLLDNNNLKVLEKALNDWVINASLGEKVAYNYVQTEGVNQKKIDKQVNKIKGIRCPEKDIKMTDRGYYEAYEIPVTQQLSDSFIKQDLQGDLFSGFQEVKCSINWNSTAQVTTLLEELGFDLMVLDKETGQMKSSTKAEVIKNQTHVSSIALLYIAYRKAQKVCSTYGQNVIDLINPVSGRIHTNINQLGTDTGRLSTGGKNKELGISYINFQNFPADPETRACFTATKGNKWGSNDYSGQESRVMAELSNDKAMLDLFNFDCGDVHSLVAKMAYPNIIKDTPIAEIKLKFPELRDSVKSELEFPINYGGDWNTIVNNSEKNEKEAKELYDNYMAGFKGIKKYQDRQRKFVMKYGFILINIITQHKSYIYDFELLMNIKKRLTYEFYADRKPYKGKRNAIPGAVKKQICERFGKGDSINSMVGVYTYHKKSGGKTKVLKHQVKIEDVYNVPVSYFFNRKSDCEKSSINYPCQGTGALMFKLASIYFYNYLVRNNLLFKVKMCVPVHDEWNIEIPEDIAVEVNNVLKQCMKDGGGFFIKKLDLPADGDVYDYWVH